jgi:hypothetical protein
MSRIVMIMTVARYSLAVGQEPATTGVMAFGPEDTCSAKERVKIAAAGSGKDSEKGTFPWLVSECAFKAYAGISGSFEDRFYKCSVLKGVSLGMFMSRMKLQVSRGCSNCLAQAPKYGSKMCKGKCWMGSCKRACMDCVSVTRVAINKCAGMTLPQLECP